MTVAEAIARLELGTAPPELPSSTPPPPPHAPPPPPPPTPPPPPQNACLRPPHRPSSSAGFSSPPASPPHGAKEGSTAKQPAEYDATASAHRTAFVASHATLRCHLRTLPATASLADLWAARHRVFGEDPSRAVLALDFDQTLTAVHRATGVAGATGGRGGGRELTLRGGEDTRAALEQMAAAGVRMCIVTAQPPSVATVRNAASECRALSIARHFDVQEPDYSPLYAALASGATLASGFRRPVAAATAAAAAVDLSDDGAACSAAAALPEATAAALLEATLRLMLLLLLVLPERTASDLVRIGAVSRTLGDGGIGYRLWDEGQQIWGAELRLARDCARPALCPVHAWQEYLDTSGAVRAAAASRPSNTPDRLLLSPSAAGRGLAHVMEVDEAHELATFAASAAGLSKRDIQWLVSSPAQELAVDAGVKIAMMGHVIAAKYNKPEGLHAWIRREQLAPAAIVFVDDNSDNVFSMFAHFAALERAHDQAKTAVVSTCHECDSGGGGGVCGSSSGDGARGATTTRRVPPPACCSVWYPPEGAATEEPHDAATREMLLELSRGPL